MVFLETSHAFYIMRFTASQSNIRPTDHPTEAWQQFCHTETRINVSEKTTTTKKQTNKEVRRRTVAWNKVVLKFDNFPPSSLSSPILYEGGSRGFRFKQLLKGRGHASVFRSCKPMQPLLRLLRTLCVAGCAIWFALALFFPLRNSRTETSFFRLPLHRWPLRRRKKKTPHHVDVEQRLKRNDKKRLGEQIWQSAAESSSLFLSVCLRFFNSTVFVFSCQPSAVVYLTILFPPWPDSYPV